jgi:septal ring factor EnvC (AmiA/AmiB activator)
MATTKRRTTTKKTPPSVRALERRVKRLEAELSAAAERYARRIERVRRAADRRLTAMMQEIATLRHHEARADALARLLAAQGVAKGNGDGEDPGLPG